jgi:putative oxidoreductase
MTRLLQLYRSTSDFSARVLRGLVWPPVDLVLRLSLAGIFLASATVKLSNWQTALFLAAHEYPVSWLNPVTAAYVGVSIELGGALLLAGGLLTRYAAALMLILSLVIQLNYIALDSQLFWVAIFGWYAVIGAGPLSLDRMLRRGLGDSALPVVPRIIASSEWTRKTIGPVYLSLLRVWLGAALVLANAPIEDAGRALRAWLPLHAVLALPRAAGVIGGSLLLAGLGTRYVAAVLLILLITRQMMGMPGADPIYTVAALAMLLIHGSGPIAVDAFIDFIMFRRFPGLSWRSGPLPEGLARIVIVGAGFGGVACATALRNVRAAIILIDRVNYHLFQPLLYQVATAALSPGDIASPVRTLFRDSHNVRVLLGTVTGVNSTKRIVLIGEKAVGYDYLVLGTGAAHSYFGKDHWAPFAPGLKRIEDATEIRRRILTAFEQAEATGDAAERSALLTFLIVGGGPTGVELAGAIAELARFGMDKDFRNFDPSRARIILVQSAPRLLPSFPEQLSVRASRALERLGVEVILGSRVEQIDANGVGLSGTRIAARTVLWAAGVEASPAAKWLQVAADASGRVKVAPDLSVPGLSNVFVIGDAAACNAWHQRPVPGLAPAAKQEGKYVASLIRSRIEGRPSSALFSYRHRGSLATIGRKAAIADFGFIRLWGAPAWWLWGAVHVGSLVGVRNRMSTMINWFWSYLTFDGSARLITGSELSSGGGQSGLDPGR